MRIFTTMTTVNMFANRFDRDGVAGVNEVREQVLHAIRLFAASCLGSVYLRAKHCAETSPAAIHSHSWLPATMQLGSPRCWRPMRLIESQAFTPVS